MKKIKIDGITIEVKECKTLLSKGIGLMFSRDPTPLLFVFSKPTHQAFHSFFCKKFRAIWFINGRIIDDKIIKPFNLYIKPKEKYDRVLEIPL